jgi:hypothetical protein
MPETKAGSATLTVGDCMLELKMAEPLLVTLLDEFIDGLIE